MDSEVIKVFGLFLMLVGAYALASERIYQDEMQAKSDPKPQIRAACERWLASN